MKTLVTVLVGLALIPLNAKAINEEWSAVAGFVGGLLVANAFDNDNHRVERTTHYVRETPVHYRTKTYHRRVPEYTWVSTRVYVPGRWKYRYNDCGYREKYWSPGHYRIQREKVYNTCDNW